MGSEKKREGVDEEDQMIDERLGRTTNIKTLTPVMVEQPATFSTQSPFSISTSASGTLKLSTTLTSSNPPFFLQGLSQIDAVCFCFRILSLLARVNQSDTCVLQSST